MQETTTKRRTEFDLINKQELAFRFLLFSKIARNIR